MKDVLNLTKILLKNSFQGEKKNKSKTIGRLLVLLAYILIFGYLAAIVVFLCYQLLNFLIKLNQPAIYLNLILGATVAVALFRTLFSAVNVLYFSKDLEYLLPLPINPSKILMAKWNVLVISNYIIEIFIVLPALILYGIMLDQGVLYYLYAALVFVLLPVIPVILISFLMSILMRFTKFIKNKDFVQYLTVAITLLIVIGVQFIGTGEQITEAEVYEMLTKTNGVVEYMSKAFSTITVSLKALINSENLSGLINIVILFVVTVIFYILLAKFSSKMYIKSATSSLSNGIKRKENLKISGYKQNSKVGSYIKKEFLNLIRNPIFCMQCILPPILFPFIFAIPIYLEISKDEVVTSEFMQVANSFLASPAMLGIVLAILGFIFMFNFISATAVSRDSENAILMKTFPISLKKQTIYKMLPAVIMNVFPILFVLVVLKLLVGVSYSYLGIITFLAMLVNFLVNYIGIIIDLKNPKLNWSSEYTVVKQNMNIFYLMVVVLIEVGILVLSAFKFSNIYLYLTISIVFLLVQIGIVNIYVSKNENKLYKDIH